MEKYITSLDFDGTLRVDMMEKEFGELLNVLPDTCIYVINTGRGINILQNKVKLYFPDYYDKFIQKMDYFICNNGTDIYYKLDDNLRILDGWSVYLLKDWDREKYLNILTPITDKLEFELYPEYYNFKLLYYFLRKDFTEAEKAVEELREALSEFSVKLVCAESSQKPPDGFRRFLCEIFPLKAGKDNALIFLKKYIEEKGIIVKGISCFGDDRNDLQTIVDMPLENEYWYGCLVGNSSEWIKEKALNAQAISKGKIIIAPPEYPGPEGIQWIMKKLNWIPN